MAISRFQSTFKVRTDMMDNITPNNTVQMNASVPAGEWKPAAWLPTIWQNEASKDFFVISSGKVVSFDGDGRIVPSGLLRRCLAATAVNGGDTIITYTQSDVDAKVIDIRTGAFVTKADVLANSTVSLKELAIAAKSLSWHNDALGNDTTAEYIAAAKKFLSAPVGIAAYDVYVWAGDDAANLHFTNYQKQHLIQFFTDIQMRVAHVCNHVVTKYDVLDADLQTSAQLLDSTPHANFKPGLSGLDLSNVVAYNLGKGKVCSNTTETPVTFTAWAGNRERSNIELLAKAGDWYLDADAGVMYFYEDGGNAIPVDSAGDALSQGNGAEINFFEYSSAVSQKEQMMHLVGDAVAGDKVTFDSNSNFKVLPPLSLTAIASAQPADIADVDDHVDAAFASFALELEDRHFEESLVVGRVLEFQKEPRGLLERVRTGWNGSEFGADAQMPGSATKGFTDLITLSDETVADEIAIINVKIQ